jgi:pyruvate/2-oxoglutarate dehydrogenase complex dihydrolipoamide dehydrogenase (E3) component
MAQQLLPDLCVIGAGSAGLSVAAGASQMGASVVLIEKGRMGGECLNSGCVPSKALLAAAHEAHARRSSARLGLAASEPAIDLAKVYDHVHGVIAEIAPQDSVERYEGLGVRVIQAPARFTGPDTLEADGIKVRARRFVLATGSHPALPSIEGLERVSFYTNENIFDSRVEPGHLIVIGAGPVGAELGQAYRRLGARVTLLEANRLLARDDPELARLLAERLKAEGVVVEEGVRVSRVEGHGSGIAVEFTRDGESRRIEGSHLLVAAGRRANIEGLDLERAGVSADERGIKVDRRLKTSNRRIYAIGDAVGPYRLTHAAGYHAGIVIRNALFRLPARVDYGALPWVTYTDPELAHVGLKADEARERLGAGVRILRWAFNENDRAVAERQTDGLVKLVTTKKGRILGATILGARAGELIQPWGLAIECRLKASALANMIAPYPTYGEVNKRVAGSFYIPALFSERTAKIVRFLARFG